MLKTLSNAARRSRMALTTVLLCLAYLSMPRPVGEVFLAVLETYSLVEPMSDLDGPLDDPSEAASDRLLLEHCLSLDPAKHSSKPNE